jgi:hypothetical protein
LLAKIRGEQEGLGICETVQAMVQASNGKVPPPIALLAVHLRDPRITDLFRFRHYYSHTPQQRTDAHVATLFLRWIRKAYPNSKDDTDWMRAHLGFLEDLQIWLRDLRNVIDDPESFLKKQESTMEQLQGTVSTGRSDGRPENRS